MFVMITIAKREERIAVKQSTGQNRRLSIAPNLKKGTKAKVKAH